jgi:hypothetical protein
MQSSDRIVARFVKDKLHTELVDTVHSSCNSSPNVAANAIPMVLEMEGTIAICSHFGIEGPVKSKLACFVLGAECCSRSIPSDLLIWFRRHNVTMIAIAIASDGGT